MTRHWCRACLTSLAAFTSILAVLPAIPDTAAAQYLPATDQPIQFGQVHFYIRNVDAQKRFWTALGAEPHRVVKTTIGAMKLPNVIIFLDQRAAAADSQASTIRHVGLQVPDLRATLDRLEAEGYPSMTKAELQATHHDLAFDNRDGSRVSFLRGPDDITIEIIENRMLTSPVRFDHVHFAATDVKAVQAWYVRNFGATPSVRGSHQAADLPNHVSLLFSPTTDRPLPTKGQVLDHIGFQIGGLQAFCEKLARSGVQVDRNYTKVAGRDRAFAYVADPWGTSIELNEGDPGLVRDEP
jgi:catechol 2,3-dioxygenase-like lactoylglutathione lyase family enzyme